MLGTYFTVLLIFNRKSNLKTVKGNVVFTEVNYVSAKPLKYKLNIILKDSIQDYFLILKPNQLQYIINKLKFNTKVEMMVSKSIYKNSILQLKVNDKILVNANEFEKQNLINLSISLIAIAFFSWIYLVRKSEKIVQKLSDTSVINQ